MEKKLPGVFANKIDKTFTNNKQVDYSSGKVEEDSYSQQFRSGTNTSVPEKNINQKLHDIFGSPRYVYKADVKITTKSGVIHKKIIGQNNTHLITIDNELIPITDILDIGFIEP